MFTLLTESSEVSKDDSIYLKLEILVDPESELILEPLSSANPQSPETEHPNYNDDEEDEFEQKESLNLEKEKDISSEGSNSAKEEDPTNKHLKDEKSNQIKGFDLENETELSSEGSKSGKEEVLPKINFDDSYVCLDCNNRLLFDSDMLSG
jgi:hypothetical protein